MTNIVALASMVLAASVDVELSVKKPLRLNRNGELKGLLSVQVTNRGTEPVALQHRDVHGLRFTPSSGDAGTELIFHSCDCGFEQGLQPPPEARTFTLKPGETHRLDFDDFSCGGGPFRAPRPGRYLVTFSLGPAERAELKTGALDLKQCESDLRAHAPGPFASQPVTVELGKPR